MLKVLYAYSLSIRNDSMSSYLLTHDSSLIPYHPSSTIFNAKRSIFIRS